MNFFVIIIPRKILFIFDLAILNVDMNVIAMEYFLELDEFIENIGIHNT